MSVTTELVFAVPSDPLAMPWVGRRVIRTVPEMVVGEPGKPVQVEVPAPTVDDPEATVTVEVESAPETVEVERVVVESDAQPPAPFNGVTWTVCDEKTFKAALAVQQKAADTIRTKKGLPPMSYLADLGLA